MRLFSESFADGQPIAPEFAFCRIDPKSHVTLSSNRNPHLAWSDAPVGTRSFAIVCHDPDVPGSPEDVNQEGREIPSTLKRIEFFHWILVDLPASVDAIAAGEFSDNVTPKGKSGPAARHGARQGINDYTAWFAGDAQMGGDYYGYDGPCPPWNDERLHHYVFTLYALDVARCAVEGRFNGADVRKAIADHVLAQAGLTGIYSLNPTVRG